VAKQGFISWSGDESRLIAEALKEFFSFALPNPTLFVASRDLQAGEVWFTEIADRLDACDIGGIVVTPQNINKPWLHFEAGAISKRVGRSAAIPLLCGVANGELAGTPLAQLQALTVSELNMRKLTSRLNDLLELGVSESHIDSTFPVWWERYSGRISNPDLWKGAVAKKAAPTIADLSVQMAQVAAAISDLTDRVERSTRNVSPGITGQGDLATMNYADLSSRLLSRRGSSRRNEPTLSPEELSEILKSIDTNAFNFGKPPKSDPSP
jgi:hypothetical protein